MSVPSPVSFRQARIKRRCANQAGSSKNFGRPLNSQVGLQFRDRSRELSRLIAPWECRTGWGRHEDCACRTVGAQLDGRRMARDDQETQRPRRLAARVATARMICALSGCRRRVRRAARHGVRALLAWARQRGQDCEVGRVLLHLRHPDMALRAMAGRGRHRQADLGP
jgi:hypothetical protein